MWLETRLCSLVWMYYFWLLWEHSTCGREPTKQASAFDPKGWEKISLPSSNAHRKNKLMRCIEWRRVCLFSNTPFWKFWHVDSYFPSSLCGYVNAFPNCGAHHHPEEEEDTYIDLLQAYETCVTWKICKSIMTVDLQFFFSDARWLIHSLH